jgi:DUF971 family protein
MAGLTRATPFPTDLIVHRTSKTFEVAFEDGARFDLPFEYLRVYSPSAEVRGHGGGPIATVAGKREVALVGVEPVGHYAVKLVFDDGHASGLYGWDLLYELGQRQDEYWQDYLRRLAELGLSRDIA